jgi:hypothetical protein
MATSTKKVLRMTFNTALGGTVSITLPEPRVDITTAEVEAAMDLVIAKNIFLGSAGAMISKNDIKIVNTTTDDLYEAPIA